MLYYSFTLSQVAIALGLFYILSHAFAFFKFKPVKDYLLGFHRNVREGYILFSIAVAWTVWILATTDLMEYTNIRFILILVALALAGAVARFLPEYLSVRSLGLLLMLGAKVLLDAAFLRDEPIKFVITITAYVYVVLGIVFVGSPYFFRDWIRWIYNREKLAQAAWLAGCAFGGVLLVLGLFFY